jgi:hypothetical protein
VYVKFLRLYRTEQNRFSNHVRCLALLNRRKWARLHAGPVENPPTRKLADWKHQLRIGSHKVRLCEGQIISSDSSVFEHVLEKVVRLRSESSPASLVRTVLLNSSQGKSRAAFKGSSHACCKSCIEGEPSAHAQPSFFSSICSVWPQRAFAPASPGGVCALATME